jgi:O-antigen/teichoic acid export membrane protein
MTFLTFSVGLAGVGSRFFPQFSRTKDGGIPGFERWFLRAAITAILLTTAFTVWAARFFAGVEDADLTGLVAFWAVSSSTWALASARAQGLFRFRQIAISSLLFSGLAVLGAFVAVPLAAGDITHAVLVVAAANLVGAVSCLIGTNLFARAPGRSLASGHATAIRRYGVNVWSTSVIGSLVWSRGEVSLIKLELGDTALGYYSVALTLAGAINLGVSFLTGALSPRIMRAWDEGQRKELARFSTLSTDILSMVAAIAAGFIVCFGNYFITLLFGHAFAPSSVLASILAVGALGVSSGCATAVVQAATNARYTRNITTAGAIVLFGGGFVLIHYVGLEGAALIRSAILLVSALLTLAYLGRILEHRAGARRNMIQLLLLTGLLSGLVLIVTYGSVVNVWVSLVLFATHSALAVAICCGGRGHGIARWRELAKFGNQ